MSRFGTMRIGGLALAVASLTALAACSSSSSSSSSSTTTTQPGAITQPGSVGEIPAAGTPSGTAGSITYALTPGAVPNWILPMPTSATNSVYNVFNFEWQMWPPMYYAPQRLHPDDRPHAERREPADVVQRRQDDDDHAEALEVEHRPDAQLARTWRSPST